MSPPGETGRVAGAGGGGLVMKVRSLPTQPLAAVQLASDQFGRNLEELDAVQVQQLLGQLRDTGHDWDDDPAEWVRTQRRGDTRRAG